MAVQAPSHIICPMALQTLRECLFDVTPARKKFTDAFLIDRLRDNRETVFVQDPLSLITNSWIWSNALYLVGRVPRMLSNFHDSLMIPEPDLRSYQSLRYLRNWDSLTEPVVYRYGQKKTVTTDYSVNFTDGRIVFTEDVQTYEPIQAAFCYYKIIWAMYDALLMSYGRTNRLVSWKEQDGTEEHYGSVNDALAAIGRLKASYSPSNVPQGRVIY